jgi:hypothetical protein
MRYQAHAYIAASCSANVIGSVAGGGTENPCPSVGGTGEGAIILARFPAAGEGIKGSGSRDPSSVCAPLIRPIPAIGAMLSSTAVPFSLAVGRGSCGAAGAGADSGRLTSDIRRSSLDGTGSRSLFSSFSFVFLLWNGPRFDDDFFLSGEVVES